MASTDLSNYSNDLNLFDLFWFMILIKFEKLEWLYLELN